jgi:hypothetical protein
LRVFEPILGKHSFDVQPRGAGLLSGNSRSSHLSYMHSRRIDDFAY